MSMIRLASTLPYIAPRDLSESSKAQLYLGIYTSLEL